MPEKKQGTPSFVAEVLATVGKLEKEDLTQRVGQLGERIESIKSDVHQNLRAYYENFDPNLAIAQELNGRVEATASEMKSLTDHMEKEIHGQLLTTSREYADFTAKTAEMDAVLGVLTMLVECHETLESVKSNLVNKNFVECAENLFKLRCILDAVTSKDINIVEALNVEYKVQSQNLLYHLGLHWKQVVKADFLSDSTEAVPDNYSLIINKTNTKDLLLALNRLDILDDRLKLLASNLLSFVFEPIVLSGATIDVKQKVTGASMTVKKGDGKSTPIAVFGQVEIVLNFLHEGFLDLALSTERTTMSVLGRHLSKPLVDLLVKDCLAVAVPTNHKDLAAFADVVRSTEEFHKVLVKYETEDAEALVAYVSNVNTLFANKKCQLTLQHARSLMTSEIHNMVKVVPDSSDSKSEKKRRTTKEGLETEQPNVLSANTMKFPECFISVSVQELMKLAYNLMFDACTGDEQCGLQLMYCVRNVFELFLTVVPTYHRDSLLQLPQSAALYHNNCMYVAHHLTTLGHQFRHDKPRPQTPITFLDLVQKIRQLGIDCFLAQMRHQREQLNEFLKLADGFLSVSDPTHNQSAERAVKQVYFQLNRLRNLWHEVLPSNIYHKSIGTLVNSVMDEVMRAVISLEDISANDADQLHSLAAKMIDQTPALFNQKGADLSLVVKYIPQWEKFGEFKIILNARLAQIAERWANGQGPLAAQFKSHEMKQLIRSLFQNTEVRANVLSQI